MADAVMSLQCTVTVTDWKNVILGFPAHDFDTKWLITIPMALSSWQLFKAINDVKEADDEVETPGVPENDEEAENASKELPNQGTVDGDVDNAPPVDAGKQGKHVKGHVNHQEGSSTWKEGNNGVHDTQEAWEKGEELPDGTKVWDTGKVVGENGETGVRVHIDKNGHIHGYPVDINRYLPRK